MIPASHEAGRYGRSFGRMEGLGSRTRSHDRPLQSAFNAAHLFKGNVQTSNRKARSLFIPI